MAIRICHKPRPETSAYCGRGDHIVLEIGAFSYGLEFYVHWHGEPARVVIGKYCSIAEGARFFAGAEHRTEWATTYPFSHIPDDWAELRTIGGHPATRGDVVIGNDVWLGFGCAIRSGVHVGDGAVIGMGAIVTRDVPAYAVVTGNPATVMRYRFPEDVVARLKALAWWNLPDEVVRRLAPRLCQPLTADMMDEIIAMVPPGHRSAQLAL